MWYNYDHDYLDDHHHNHNDDDGYDDDDDDYNDDCDDHGGVDSNVQGLQVSINRRNCNPTFQVMAMFI